MPKKTTKDHLFRWVSDPRCKDGREVLKDVGIYADGRLRNPQGYDDDLVRAAVEAAVERRRIWHSEIAKKAAETRRLRREHKIKEIAMRILNRTFTPGDRCAVCTRALTDAESVDMGIGPECRAPVYAHLDALARQRELEREIGAIRDTVDCFNDMLKDDPSDPRDIRASRDRMISQLVRIDAGESPTDVLALSDAQIA